MQLPALPHRSDLRLRLPGRTIRSRLTWLYGGLFALSGAVLLLIAAALWSHATSSDTSLNSRVPGNILAITGVVQSTDVVQTSAHGWALADPSPGAAAIAATPRFQSGPQRVVVGRVFTQLNALVQAKRDADLRDLLFYSGIALGIMALFSVLLGWLVAGRVLRPLRTITSTTRDISASNLHRRLDLSGPSDELHELSGTIDDLLSRLERSFQAQRQFVANASHELRTPLTTLRAMAEVALAKPGPKPDQTIQLAEGLRAELDQADQLLEGLLTLARAQTEDAENAPVSLDDLVCTAVEKRRPAAFERDLQIAADWSSGTKVDGNPVLLQRLVDNLVDNAIRHNDPSGFLRVATERDGDTARIVVENSGPVLDPDEVGELVRPFRRAGTERTASETGFGLGLAIVAAIVESHGGRLALAPRPGGGLKARIELPLSECAPVGAAL